MKLKNKTGIVVIILLSVLIIVFQIGFSKHQKLPDWVYNSKHLISKDSTTALILNSSADGNLHITSWLIHNGQSGGGGVFSQKNGKIEETNIGWESDSTLIIEYNSSNEILKKEDSLYFFGKVIQIKYIAK